MKKCRNCFETKPEAEFGRKRKGHPETKAHCKRCHAEIVRGYATQKRERDRQERWDRLYGRTSTAQKGVNKDG